MRPIPSHITVTAPLGRVCPVHGSDGVEPGGAQLRVTPDDIARVRYAGSGSIRRAVVRGDLIPCDMNGAPCDIFAAAAVNDLPGGGAKIAKPKPSQGAKP
jgi:hypothetical protein